MGILWHKGVEETVNSGRRHPNGLPARGFRIDTARFGLGRRIGRLVGDPDSTETVCKCDGLRPSVDACSNGLSNLDIELHHSENIIRTKCNTDAIIVLAKLFENHY